MISSEIERLNVKYSNSVKKIEEFDAISKQQVSDLDRKYKLEE